MNIPYRLIFLLGFFFFLVNLSLAEIIHTVKPGETLEKIAKKYQVTIDDLKKWNNLKSTKIKPGLTLKIKKEKTSKVEQATEPKFHVVKKGETLKSIAQKYGLKVEDLKAWNNLKSEKVKPGTKLLLEDKNKKKEVYHVVKRGETLESIAKKYKITVETLRELNNLKENKVYVGQKLLVKKEQEKEETIKKESKPSKIETAEELFAELKRKEETLLKNNPTRRTYLNLIAEYKRIFLLYPSSEVAPLALLRMADLSYELYQKSLKKEDLKKALNWYESFLEHYPTHPEERVILEKLAKAYQEELKDSQKANHFKELLKNKYGLAEKTKEKKETSLKGEPKGHPSSGEGEEKKPKELGLFADIKKVLKVEPVTGEDYTRIIVEVSGNFEYQSNILPETKDRPPRIYIDLFPASLTDKVEREITLEHKHLQKIRVGQYDRTTVRIVLDLTSLISYKLFKLKEPDQLIIDLVGKPREEKKALAQAPKKEKKLKEKKSVEPETKVKEVTKPEMVKPKIDEGGYVPLARQLGLGVRKIVIDAGHGGEDPGAVGPNGIKEKDVALKVALKLGEILRDNLGVEVFYTRNSDVFIPLVKRPALANAFKGDLFISIHFNASPDPNAMGVEVYYLNFTTDPEAMRVAALENSVANKGLADLQDLVKAIITNTKLNESRILAEKVQQELVKLLRATYGETQNRGVKYAPFLVLVGTRMPAILVEAEFITNPIIANRLNDEAYLTTLAQGVAKGVETYINSLKLTQQPYENTIEQSKKKVN